MNDQAIEQEIQAKGKTAPRVTPANIEANIASEHYFTADDGEIGTRWYCADSEEAMINLDDNIPDSLRLLTFCVLVLRNGFTVTGESACASPENFDAEIGRNIARQNAVQKIWPLMGYALKQELHEAANRAPVPGAAHAGYSTMRPHQQRVVDERIELESRRIKLQSFLGTPIFAELDAAEQIRLREQADAMNAYSDILAERIAAF
jgi:hypothetical protein